MPDNKFKPTVSLADMLNDASIDRVLAIDTTWKVIAWNKTNEIISGIKKQDALNRHLMEIFPQLKTDEEIQSAFEFAMQGKKSFLPSKANVFNRDHYENHFTPLKDEEGHIIGVMNIMHDVSHRIKAEQQLQKLHAELKEKYRQLEKANTELATFTSITGNDLKEPLKKVYTALELIMINDGNRLSDSSKAGLRRMQASLNRIKLLLDDILAISTASSSNVDYTTVDLNHVARTVQADLLNKIKESEAVLGIQQLPSVTGSEQMIHRLFYNLLDNAIKFRRHDQPPQITVSATMVPERHGHAMHNGRNMEYICISFTDNGIGFRQEDAEKIFTMFEKLHGPPHTHGSGIGLTICRKIAEAHGGYIEAEGHPGNGATFRCYLPVALLT
jgi:PAS domain S-box-containing protein